MKEKSAVIEGHWRTKKVTIAGIDLDPVASQKLVMHSPDGFNWGYGGSGPAQLSIALLLHFSGDDKFVLKHYLTFQHEIVSHLEQTNFLMSIGMIKSWIRERSGKVDK